MSGRRGGGADNGTAAAFDPNARREVHTFANPPSSEQEDVVYQRLVAHVEGADKTSGGAYHHNSAGGFLDASAYLEMEEEAARIKKTEVLRARTESSQLALMRAAQEREDELAAKTKNRAKGHGGAASEALRGGGGAGGGAAGGVDVKTTGAAAKKKEMSKVIKVVKRRAVDDDPAAPAHGCVKKAKGTLSSETAWRKSASECGDKVQEDKESDDEGLEKILGGYGSGSGSDHERDEGVEEEDEGVYRGYTTGKQSEEDVGEDVERSGVPAAAAAAAEEVEAHRAYAAGKQTEREAAEEEEVRRRKEELLKASERREEEQAAVAGLEAAGGDGRKAAEEAANAAAAADSASLTTGLKGKLYWERYYTEKYGLGGDVTDGEGGGGGGGGGSGGGGEWASHTVTDWTAYYAKKYSLKM